MTNKLLPIVPGCRAVVVKGDDAGESCTVDTWIEPMETIREWKNGTDKAGWCVIFEDGSFGLYTPGNIMRIDGGDFESEHIRGMCQDLIDMMDASGL